MFLAIVMRHLKRSFLSTLIVANVVTGLFLLRASAVQVGTSTANPMHFSCEPCALRLLCI
jgi:predicted secreted protein